MDATTTAILKNALASLLRAALYVLGTWLVSKGTLTEGMNGQVQAHAAEIVAGVISVVGALSWSLWQKAHMNRKVDQALAASPDLTRAEFEEAHKVVEK
jgi:outer membrane protein TolC